MVRPRATAVVLFVVASMGPRAAAGAAGQIPTEHDGPRDVVLRDLAAVRRLVAPLARLDRNAPDAERAAAWTDVWQISEAVLGRPLDRDLTFADLLERHGDGGPRVAAAPGVARRDATAYQLLGIGYSARETADIISGRISLDALDTARRMRAAGMGRERAADYLDRAYRRLAELRTPSPPAPAAALTRSSVFDPLIEKYSRLHGVGPDLVRAIIDAESAFSPTALSRAGAIGLMQLMPGTARELGVDPHTPEQNIEGGIRYVSGLLRSFGAIELALVAYNGGPGYARRYARGDAVLYGETRAYVRRVLAALTDARR